MNPDDRKKIGIIILAVSAGIIASILAGNYIKESIQQQTATIAKDYDKKRQQEMAALRQDMERVKMEAAQMIQQQQAAAVVSAANRPGQPAGPVAVPMSVSVKTPAGKRAVTIQLDSLSAVGGLISPGDFVDVLANLNVPNPSGGKAETVTVMVFQNIQVLAVGTNLQPPGQFEAQQRSPALTVTFAVDPEEAGLLTFAQQNGRLLLALRATSESETRALPPANWQTLSDYILEKQGTDIIAPKSKILLEPEAQEAKPFIQIFRGGREL